MKHETPHELIEAVRPVLSGSERDAMFVAIMERVDVSAVPLAVVSPYTVFIQNVFSRPLAYVAALVIMVLGGGGTIVAANTAKPGDFLFPLDLATERVQLALASQDHKSALKATFINERIAEVNAIVSEETLSPLPEVPATSTITVTKNGEDRIARALSVLADQLTSTEEQAHNKDSLRNLLDNISLIRVDGRDESQASQRESELQVEHDKIELRTSTERIRIDHKDGELQVQSDNDDHDSESRSGDKSRTDRPSSTSAAYVDKDDDGNSGHGRDQNKATSTKEVDIVSTSTVGRHDDRAEETSIDDKESDTDDGVVSSDQSESRDDSDDKNKSSDSSHGSGGGSGSSGGSSGGSGSGGGRSGSSSGGGSSSGSGSGHGGDD